MKTRLLTALCASTGLVAAGWSPAFAADAPAIDADDIGGVVTGPKGPEGGVWVVAETKDGTTPYIKIVVTDDMGRYVLPDLPKGNYKVWSRAYGLKDSAPAKSAPGKTVNFKMDAQTDKVADAQLYPANYWDALIRHPSQSEFPGTGPKGNGIAPGFANLQEWLGHYKEQCHYCHQLGTKSTRDVPGTDKVEAWAQRINKERPKDDVTVGMHGERYRLTMNNNMTRFGRERGLNMFGDWSRRVEGGEVPTEKPPRPAGHERNLVITMWDWADGRFVHDEATSDKRNPTVNANGPVYGVDTLQGHLAILHPVTQETKMVPVPGLDPTTKHLAQGVSVHNPMIDERGRVWMTMLGGEMGALDACADPNNKFAKYYPNPSKTTRRISLYDPKSKNIEVMPVCYSTHHINFGYDKDHTVYFSGDTNVVGWINTRVLDETKDSIKSAGWCPFVLDTNGDGKIDPNKDNWNQPDGLVVKEGDPKKDTRISGFPYGLNLNPVDDSIWYAKYSPAVPSGLVRVSRGKNPPETCVTEYYEPPKKPDGTYVAFNARGVDLDSKGIAWVAFGSGQLAKFDRSKCTVTNGPKALGQHCPQAWTFYDTPGPKVSGQTTGSADWHYLAWVDLHNILGLGKDVPILPGSNSDSLLAFLPDQEKWVVMRVPYPMGFYTRGLDGRIDDVKTGWKGRGLWADYGEVPLWHQEDGEGSFGKMVKFQLRPDPLAH